MRVSLPSGFEKCLNGLKYKNELRNVTVSPHRLHLDKYSRAAHKYYYYFCRNLLAPRLVHCELLNRCCIHLQELPSQITADLRSDQPSAD